MKLRAAKLLGIGFLVGSAFGQSPTSSATALGGPSVEWAGCGPSYNGSRVGVSCAVEINAGTTMTAQGIHAWTAEDATFYKKLPSSTLSSGLLWVPRTYTVGPLVVVPAFLGAPGVTTGTAITGSFTYGVHPVVGWRRLTVGGGFRGATGSTTPRLWNLSVGWDFTATKKK
jgi:hypothetical protein